MFIVYIFPTLFCCRAQVGPRSLILKIDWLRSAVSLSTSLDLLCADWILHGTERRVASGMLLRRAAAQLVETRAGRDLLWWLFPSPVETRGGVPTLSLPTVRCCGPWWSLSPLLLIHDTHSLLHVCHFYVNECKNLHIIISIFKHQLQRFLFLQVNVRCPLI